MPTNSKRRAPKQQQPAAEGFDVENMRRRMDLARAAAEADLPSGGVTEDTPEDFSTSVPVLNVMIEHKMLAPAMSTAKEFGITSAGKRAGAALAKKEEGQKA